MRVRVKVTREDIDGHHIDNCTNCPGVTAVTKLLKDQDKPYGPYVEIPNYDTLQIFERNISGRYVKVVTRKLPKNFQDWQKAYVDHKGEETREVPETSFVVAIPAKYLKEEVIKANTSE